MDKGLLLACLAAAVAALCGCSTPSVNPIYSDDQSEVSTDDRVVGVWHEEDPKKSGTYYHIGKRTDDQTVFYPVRITSGPDAEKYGRFELRLVKLGATTYADFVPDKGERDRLGGRFGLSAMSMHVIMPVTLGQDQVSIRPLDPGKVKAFVSQAPNMTPHALRDELVILTGDTRQVQQFFRKIAGGDEVFGDTVVLTRVKDAKPDDAAVPAAAPAEQPRPARPGSRSDRPR